MNPKFLPKTFDGQVDRLTEETGEVIEIAGRVLRVVGKTGRFGLDSYHPGGGLNNAALMLSEMADLRHAMNEVHDELHAAAALVFVGPNGEASFQRSDVFLTANEAREMFGDFEESIEDFLSNNKQVQVCDGVWMREGMDYVLYKDPAREE
jgi:hypothetical protein